MKVACLHALQVFYLPFVSPSYPDNALKYYTPVLVGYSWSVDVEEGVVENECT